MRSQFTVYFGLSLTLSMTQAVFALQPAGVSTTDPISWQNPLTHGELAPRLSGRINQIRLRTADQTATWHAQVHGTRGAIQMAGEGLINWGDESLAEMDVILKELVDRNRDAFKIKSTDLVLNKKRTTYSGPYRTVVFDRYFWLEDAVRFKIERAYIAFRFKFGRLIQITNYSFGEVGIIEAPVIGPDEALQAAADDVMMNENLDKVLGKIDIELQPFFIRNGDVRFRLVYKVAIEKKRPKSVWLYSVSAADGNIVQLVSGLHSAEVHGDIKPRLPSDEILTIPMAYAKIKGPSGEEQANERGEFTMDPANATGFLTSQFATPRRNGAVASANADLHGQIRFYADAHLDEAMTFFHIARVNSYVQQFIQNGFLKKPISVNTQVTDGSIKDCNAWYSQWSKDLNFLPASERCNNSSHIADVIYHEWGHALDDALGGIGDDAFSEGIGDITAFLLTGDSRLAPEFFKGDDRPIRDASVVKVYPRDRDRNPHKEGLIISGAWFEVMQAMKARYGEQEGADKTANLFFKHIVSTESYVDSYAGALVIDDDDGDLSNCTPHMCIFNTAFAKRGLTSYDDRCRTVNACGSTTIGSD